jgi:hypothetical protein
MLACFGARNIIGAGQIQIHSLDKPEPVMVEKPELVWSEDGFVYR